MMKEKMITFIAVSAITLALFTAPVIAAKIFFATCLTGGTTGCLDRIDGAGLAENDGAIFIPASGTAHFYVLDADSAASETSPSIIKPDTNAGDKRWLKKSYTPD